MIQRIREWLAWREFKRLRARRVELERRLIEHDLDTAWELIERDLDIAWEHGLSPEEAARWIQCRAARVPRASSASADTERSTAKPSKACWTSETRSALLDPLRLSDEEPT